MSRAQSFGAVAERYDRFRPPLAARAAAWLGARPGATLVDVAAGTGLATRTFAALGATVISVEPDERMLAVLRERSPGADARQGTAESLPVDDGCADVVVVVSAWHWVDEPRAFAEVARVLRDGGTLGIAWNSIDRRVPWVHDLFEGPQGTAAHEVVAHRGRRIEVPASAPFAAAETEELTWTWRRGVEDVVGLSRTYSGVITSTDEERADHARTVRETATALAGDEGEIDLPMVSMCWRATRAARDERAGY